MPDEYSNPDISVILPALLADDCYLRCIYSIRAALFGKLSYEIITIVPEVERFHSFENEDVRIVLQESCGIYQAMNFGITKALGEYIYFIGQDDVMLPESAEAINYGKRRNADLIISDVFWGNNSIYRNHKIRHSLVWRNWCHQGLFYKRSTFIYAVGSFPVQFKAQADHYVNILFTRNRSLQISRYSKCVAWYSSAGFSSRSPDTRFRDAFPGIIRRQFGLASFVMVVLRRAILKGAKIIWNIK